MTAKTTMTVWAVYVLGLGVVLTLVPNLLLGIFGIAPTDEVWVRVAGMLLLFLGAYYAAGVRAEARWLWRASVPVRLSVVVFFGGFVAFAGAPPVILVFAGADVAAAVWTAMALRREG